MNHEKICKNVTACPLYLLYGTTGTTGECHPDSHTGNHQGRHQKSNQSRGFKNPAFTEQDHLVTERPEDLGKHAFQTQTG